METVITVAVLAAILFGAGRYVYKAKQRGQTCIGCPQAAQCAQQRKDNCGGCGCGCSTDSE